MNKKRILAILLALAMVFGMAACTKDSGDNGGSGDSADLPSFSQGITADGFFEGVTAKDYVTLGQYEGISVPAALADISLADIQGEIDGLMSSYTDTKEVTDRPAQLGDTVDIDYSGFMDGEQFEGGTGNNPSLVLGSGSFIDGFEDGIVGHSAGDNFDLELHFPDPYPNNPDFSGKAATFVVTLNSISETVEPELTDAFVAENFQSDYGWSTVEEMRSNIAEGLRYNAIFDYVSAQIEDFDVSEVPESMIEYQINSMKGYYEQMAAAYGMTTDDLISAIGVGSLDELVEQYREQNVASARTYLINQAIAEDAGIKVTQEDIDEMFSDMEDSEFQEIVDYYGLNYIKFYILNQKVQDLLVDSAVVE